MNDSTNTTLNSEPTEEQFMQWFREFNAVFSVSIDNQLYIYRRLTRREYNLLVMIEDEVTRENSLVETVVLWPLNYKVDELGKPGIPKTLSAYAMRDSGFTDDNVKKRDQLQEALQSNPELQMETLVEYVFGYAKGRFDKYLDWSNDELIDAYVRALWVLNIVEQKNLVMQDQDTSKPLTPAQMIEKMKKEGTYVEENPNDTPEEALKKFRKAQRAQAIRNVGLARAHHGTRPPPNIPNK